ncbi:competence type IV pilus major pilin ComGC [Sutcliffiella horikoshii]|uniref:competence type IV pilus major pilin ComGC n=1 Tax=Sutcliffiella horikoshii TaxID=79883 RepID=UPI001F34604A|nr:competence type IV pilus major pilin ComGC [Sutcliffiella horikoshii]MCG1022680.1 prepilin-type N-terminal cleavage/methylation domain-containing protein [Sutcliffiella horikoshii]
MRKLLNDERGFTLVEMLLVMLVITVLLLIMIPNVTKNSSIIGDKGCEALLSMVDAQIQAYRLDTGSQPNSIDDLNSPEYLEDRFDEEHTLNCPNGNTITIVNNKAVANGG